MRRGCRKGAAYPQFRFPVPETPEDRARISEALAKSFLAKESKREEMRRRLDEEKNIPREMMTRKIGC